MYRPLWAFLLAFSLCFSMPARPPGQTLFQLTREAGREWQAELHAKARRELPCTCSNAGGPPLPPVRALVGCVEWLGAHTSIFQKASRNTHLQVLQELFIPARENFPERHKAGAALCVAQTAHMLDRRFSESSIANNIPPCWMSWAGIMSASQPPRGIQGLGALRFPYRS